jgi:hypothetical protein
MSLVCQRTYTDGNMTPNLDAGTQTRMHTETCTYIQGNSNGHTRKCKWTLKYTYTRMHALTHKHMHACAHTKILIHAHTYTLVKTFKTHITIVVTLL